MSLLPPPVWSAFSDDWARSKVALAPLTDAWALSTCCDEALVVPPLAVLFRVAVPAYGLGLPLLAALLWAALLP
jgi:hypothetical protein